MNKVYFSIVATILGLALTVSSVYAQSTIKTVQVQDGIYMLTGDGGNIGLFVGADGSFMIDDKFAPLTEDILAAVKAVNGDIPRFLLNTHYHGDHTGGNENFGKAGSIIVAHHNVRKRMGVEQFSEVLNTTIFASPDSALPVITFADNVTFHWNDDSLELHHIANAHSDGDTLVHFIKANVIHTGDIVFNGRYPFIDYSAGGSIRGMIVGTKKILALSDEKTLIIPGHGPLTDKASLEQYLLMLETSRGRIKSLIDSGKTLEEILLINPLNEYDKVLSWEFVSTATWTRLVYHSL